MKHWGGAYFWIYIFSHSYIRILYYLDSFGQIHEREEEKKIDINCSLYIRIIHFYFLWTWCWVYCCWRKIVHVKESWKSEKVKRTKNGKIKKDIFEYEYRKIWIEFTISNKNLYVYAVRMNDVQNDANQSCMNDKYTITFRVLVAIFKRL